MTPLINCLAYALRFWEQHPEYLIYYNSGHAINSDIKIRSEFIKNKPVWLSAEHYGYDYFAFAFAGLLDDYEMKLLKKYFGKQ